MKSLLIFIPILLFAISPFESPKARLFDTSAYETKESKIIKQASENEKIKCRYVCDKKIYKEKKISEAVSYYKSLRSLDSESSSE